MEFVLLETHPHGTRSSQSSG